jgi:hypothetical protein
MILTPQENGEENYVTLFLQQEIGNMIASTDTKTWKEVVLVDGTETGRIH